MGGPHAPQPGEKKISSFLNGVIGILYLNIKQTFRWNNRRNRDFYNIPH